MVQHRVAPLSRRVSQVVLTSTVLLAGIAFLASGTRSWLGFPVIVGAAIVGLSAWHARPQRLAAAPRSSIGSTLEAAPVFTREINRARRTGRPLSVVSIRCVGGQHRAGDLLLQMYAVGLRDTDMWVVDFDRDEVVGLAPEIARPEAQHMFVRLVDSLPGHIRPLLVHTVATFPEDGLTFEALLDHCRRLLDSPVNTKYAPTPARQCSEENGRIPCDIHISTGYTDTRLTG